MFRKRKRKPSAAQGTPQGSGPAVSAADGQGTPPAPPVRPPRENKAPPLLTDTLKAAIEKAAERAKVELAAKGKLDPMIFFAHEDGTMKIASISLRDGQQKDVLIGRIKDKALAENAYAVLVVYDPDPKRHRAVLSAVSPGAKASVHLDYAYDGKTKTVTSWGLRWLNQPVQTPFLEGIF
jgi:hypothetical protein